MFSISSQASADSLSVSKPQECEPPLFARLNLIAAPSCESTGRTCRSTRTCARSTAGNTGAQSSLFAGDTLASPSAWQDEGVARKMKDISGRRCIALFERSGRDGSLPKMLLDILASASTKLPHRWKLKASPSGRLLFQLAPLARRTDETACGLWAMPNTMDHLPQRSPEALLHQAQTTRKGRTRPANLWEQVNPTTMALWPTPDVRGFTNDGALLMLKEKCHSREEWAAMAYRSGSAQKQKLWPTPNASDCRDRGNLSHPVVQRRAAKGKQLGLSMVVSESSGQLNPTWVEWLMGFPTEWSVCAPSAMPSYRKSRSSSGKPFCDTSRR